MPEKTLALDAELVSPDTPATTVAEDATASLAVPSAAIALRDMDVHLLTARQREALLDELAKEPRQQGVALSEFEQSMILYLWHQKHLTQVEIAKRLNTNQATVSRHLRKLHDTTLLAKAKLRAKAADIAEQVDPFGDPKGTKVAIQLLKAIKSEDGERVLEPDKPVTDASASTTPGVFVGVKVDLNELKKRKP